MYDPRDPDLVAAGERVRELCRELNATRVSEHAQRRRILRDLFGRVGETFDSSEGSQSRKDLEMTVRKTWLVLAAMVLTSMSVGAQIRWGRGPLPRLGACFYEDVDFGGEYFCLRRGEDAAVLPDAVNDRISSIRIFGDVDVVVFQDARFRGDAARFSTDMKNLDRERWNDIISSLRVEETKWGADRRRAPAWGRPSLPREGACFYEHVDFGGEYFCVPRGASYAELPRGFNDRISSIRVMRARVTLFEHADFSGRSERIDSDVRALDRRWNDMISSFRVF